MRKDLDILFIGVMSLFVVLIIFSFSFIALIYDFDFYKEEFTKLDVYNESNESYVNNISNNLIEYFDGEAALFKESYTEREILHLQDIKNLLYKLNFLFYSFLFLFLIFSILFYFRNSGIVWRYFVVGGSVTLLLIFLLYLISLLNFDILFNNFHLFLFNNDFWILEGGSTLVTLFPFQFFIDALSRVLVYSGILGFVSLLFGLFLRQNYINHK